MSGNMTADSIPYNDYDDYSKGREALMYYHNAMVRFYSDKYKISFNELLRGLTARSGQKFFMEGLGLGIISADMSLSQVNEAMTTLARQSNGKIPATNGAFKNALIGVATIGSWVDMTAFVSSETAKTVVIGVANVGQKVIDVGEGVLDSTVSLASNLKWIVPIILIGGALIYVNNYSKR
jgi:hypothetical protein